MHLTIKQAAKKLGMCPSAVRRIARLNEIGELVHSHLKILTEEDFNALKSSRKPVGRPKKAKT